MRTAQLRLLALFLGLTLGAQAGPGLSTGSAWPLLPVLHNGRVMPVDSFARSLLLSFSGRGTFERQPAEQWLARLFFAPDLAAADPIFLINHPEVLEALNLSGRERTRVSAAQLRPVAAELARLVRAAAHRATDERSPVDVELIRLHNNLQLYEQLEQGLAVVRPRADLRVDDPALREALQLPASGGALSLLEVQQRGGKLEELAGRLRADPAAGSPAYRQQLDQLGLALRMAATARPPAVPALLPDPAASPGHWLSPAAALRDPALDGELAALGAMASAYQMSDAAAFQKAAAQLLDRTRARTAEPRHLAREVWLNRIDPFYRSEIFYGLAFLVALAALMARPRLLHLLAAVLVVAALLPHTYGLVARMIIMHRPPVTNLYSTFVFVAWTCAALGLVLEILQRNRLGLLGAAACGLALLLTARRFGDDGDTMGVMVAVLDSNFWLATHVVTISMGYAGCCLSGLLGHIYLLQRLRGDALAPRVQETFRAIFGTQAFGLIFTFIGTMLGGVWADQSWGRFWGWDPKENGALVIVLWSALLFHARLGGMIGPRGFAAGSVVGIIAVLLAWMGVNLLGVGLHSYGFTSGLARGLYIACAAELAFLAVLLILTRRRPPATPPAAAL